MDFAKRFFQAWKHDAKFVGDFQARLFLTVFYFTLLVPFGLLAKIFYSSRPSKQASMPSWQSRQKDETTITSAQRQF